MKKKADRLSETASDQTRKLSPEALEKMKTESDDDVRQSIQNYMDEGGWEDPMPGMPGDE